MPPSVLTSRVAVGLVVPIPTFPLTVKSVPEPLMSREPVNLCVSSAGLSPNIVEPSENEVVTCVTVDLKEGEANLKLYY